MDFTQFTLTYSETTVILAGQCLKFCDDTPSAAMLPNLFQQDGAPAHRSRHTVAYLRSSRLRVPTLSFVWTNSVGK